MRILSFLSLAASALALVPSREINTGINLNTQVESSKAKRSHPCHMTLALCASYKFAKKCGKIDFYNAKCKRSG